MLLSQVLAAQAMQAPTKRAKRWEPRKSPQTMTSAAPAAMPPKTQRPGMEALVKTSESGKAMANGYAEQRRPREDGIVGPGDDLRRAAKDMTEEIQSRLTVLPTGSPH